MTGVQTCALPISAEREASVPDSDSRNDRPVLETPSSSQSQSGIAYLYEVVSGDDLVSYSPAMSAESPEVSSANNSSHESNRKPSVYLSVLILFSSFHISS